MNAWMTLFFRNERMANDQDAVGSDRESGDFF